MIPETTVGDEIIHTSKKLMQILDEKNMSSLDLGMGHKQTLALKILEKIFGSNLQLPEVNYQPLRKHTGPSKRVQDLYPNLNQNGNDNENCQTHSNVQPMLMYTHLYPTHFKLKQKLQHVYANSSQHQCNKPEKLSFKKLMKSSEADM